jgi:hypothetical protein
LFPEPRTKPIKDERSLLLAQGSPNISKSPYIFFWRVVLFVTNFRRVMSVEEKIEEYNVPSGVNVNRIDS